MTNGIKPLTIAGITLKNRYIQGPMAGLTDLAMRTLALENGAGLTYTEMISTNALAYDSEDTLAKVQDTQKDIGPIALQLFGYELPNIEKAIAIVEEYGKFTFLDFNLGCPVPKVMKQNAGSALLKDLDYLYKLMSLVVSRSHHPVIAKTRLGFNEPAEILKIVETLQSAGVQAIAIHGRTRNEFYAGQSHYDSIAKAKEIARIPIIANGNIDETNGLAVLTQTATDGLMIARKALGNPLIFPNMERSEQGLSPLPLNLKTQKELLKHHLDLEYNFTHLPEHTASLQMRTIAPAYFSTFPNIKEIRSLLVKCQNREDYLKVIATINANEGKNDTGQNL